MSASHLADVEGVMVWVTQREWAEAVQVSEDAIIYRPLAPAAIRLRIVGRAIALLSGVPRGGEVARLIGRLSAGQDGTLAGVVARAGPSGEWIFRKEAPRKGGANMA
jgi:tRNA(Ile)-lysidine synthase